MKKQVIAVLVAAIGLVVASRFIPLNPAQGRAHLVMQSDPYPLVIGWTKLFFSVLDENGVPVDVSSLEVAVEMAHAGMLPLYAPVSKLDVGTFETPVVWSMSGQWLVNVTAALPDGYSRVDDTFEVYVYPTTMTLASYQSQFRSASQNRALISDPERELAIIIPQGTQAMMLTGMLEDIIPSEIRLSLSGRNTLIIQNNDLVDHVVGPFSIHAGEMIRQKFTIPNVFQGVCSVNTAATVSIIVED